MTSEEIEAIVGGYHGDPFRILGPHAVNGRREDAKWEVRAFLPHATAAEVVTGWGRFSMERVHPQGVFAARLDRHPGPYRLRITGHDGATVEQEDPYRFGPLLTDFELHLHGEGTLYEAYKTLGAHIVEVEGVRGVRFAVWAPNAAAVSVVGD
ncbi:MAG TPA: 1,4-alpha-glucan branching enzyme, partial [Bryobacterales bacterium]|nr:1,4-alpha-glucan branching enzyme [Bryobacterales bacterium]